MDWGFREQIIIERETNIELFQQLNEFISRMESHIEKFPNYDYSIELLGKNEGTYGANIIIERYDNKKTELAEGDSSSHGVL